MANVIVQGVEMSTAAAENVRESSTNVAADLEHLSSGVLTPTTLLEICLDGADADRVQGWNDYVEALSSIATTTEEEG